MSQKVTAPPFLNDFFQESFMIRKHIQEFLGLDSQTLELKFKHGKQKMADLGHKDFDWSTVKDFYGEKVRELYLFELGAWHLASYEYIADTLRLVADYAVGKVLDFGGGIGTHAIGAALSPAVEQVVYCDINPINLEFVQYRAEQMGLSNKIVFCLEVPEMGNYDTIMCFDVLEHLPDPVECLLDFEQWLNPEGKMILNWYFFKGFNQEYPMHLDDPQVIEKFFMKLQSQFLEVFHPYHITGRCYRKLST
jgi:SAM-dependent methyltransferase